MIVGLPVRNDRNGAKASKWVLAQAYNVEAAARDINTPLNIMFDIADNGTSRVIGFLASNKGITREVAEAIYANQPNDAIKDKLASNNVTPQDILLDIAYSTDQWRTKKKILTHRNAPQQFIDYNLPKSRFLLVSAIAPSKLNSYRGQVKYFGEEFQDIAMLSPYTSIKSFAESIPYVSHFPTLQLLLSKRGQELIDFLNLSFGLSLTPSDQLEIVRVIKKNFV